MTADSKIEVSFTIREMWLIKSALKGREERLREAGGYDMLLETIQLQDLTEALWFEAAEKETEK